MLKIAIVEDETAAAQHLSQCLQRYRDESKVEMEVCVYEDAATFLKTYQEDHSYSIVFMDISMPGMDGMAASRRLREIDQNVILIFVTSMAQYAIEGYEVNAFDFIVKPVNYYSFKLKMKKAVAAWSAQAPARIMVVNETGNWYINAPDIYYVEVMSHKRIFHTVHGDVETSGSLKDVEKQVSGEDFFRCNYCYLVNLGHVTSVRGDRVTVGGQSLIISRNRKKEFMQRLAQYYGRKNK